MKMLFIVLAIFALNGCGLGDGLAQDFGLRDGEVQTLEDTITMLEDDIISKELEISALEISLNNALGEIDRIKAEHELSLLTLQLEALEEELATVDEETEE